MFQGVIIQKFNFSLLNLITVNTFGFGSVFLRTDPHTTITVNTIHIRNFFIITDIDVHGTVIGAVKTIDAGFYIPENLRSLNFKEFSDILKYIHHGSIRTQVTTPEPFYEKPSQNYDDKGDSSSNTNSLWMGKSQNRTEFHIQILYSKIGKNSSNQE